MAKSTHKTGDWGKLNNLINRLPAIMSSTKQEGLAKTGLKAESIAVKHLRNQDLGWQGLKGDTLKQKLRKGQSNKTLIATTDYMQSITSFVKKDTAFAGVVKNSMTRQGRRMVSVAAVHEFGNDNIPARPLWRPTFKETLTWIKKEKLFGEKALAKMKRGL